MRYHSLGRIPAKRHVQYRDPDAGNGSAPLLVEEVMGFEGFSGNESILYHLFSPCRVKDVGDFTKIELEEWVPDTHVHRLTHTRGLEPSGDSVLGRRVLQYNDDVEIGMCVPEREADYFYRDGEGDEVIFVHEGSGVVETVFGTLEYRKHDYIVIPRGTTYRFRFDEPQRWLTFYTPGEIETPNRYRNRYGQLLEHAPFSQRDFHPPAELLTHRDRGEHVVKVRVRGGYQDYVVDYNPLDVVGWDGYVYPYTFNIADFEPKAGRLHQPPPAHQTFQGPNFVICSFCPRMLDWDPQAVVAALPPLQRAERRGHVLRRGRLRGPQGRRDRLVHAAPVRVAARPAAGHGREDAGDDAHGRARRDVRHVPPAEADDARRETWTTRATRTPGTRTPPSVREFTWVDGERTIHFGPAAGAVAALGGPGYTLLTTPRAPRRRRGSWRRRERCTRWVRARSTSSRAGCSAS